MLSKGKSLEGLFCGEQTLHKRHHSFEKGIYFPVLLWDYEMLGARQSFALFLRRDAGVVHPLIQVSAVSNAFSRVDYAILPSPMKDWYLKSTDTALAFIVRCRTFLMSSFLSTVTNFFWAMPEYDISCTGWLCQLAG